jgi:hypothetical protein
MPFGECLIFNWFWGIDFRDISFDLCCVYCKNRSGSQKEEELVRKSIRGGGLIFGLAPFFCYLPLSFFKFNFCLIEVIHI